jgi:hypothetical protein
LRGSLRPRVADRRESSRPVPRRPRARFPRAERTRSARSGPSPARSADSANVIILAPPIGMRLS